MEAEEDLSAAPERVAATGTGRLAELGKSVSVNSLERRVPHATAFLSLPLPTRKTMAMAKQQYHRNLFGNPKKRSALGIPGSSQLWES